MYSIGARVVVFNNLGSHPEGRIGEICGYGFLQATPVYLVKLDKAFWSDDKTTCISVLAVNECNLKLDPNGY